MSKKISKPNSFIAREQRESSQFASQTMLFLRDIDTEIALERHLGTEVAVSRNLLQLLHDKQHRAALQKSMRKFSELPLLMTFALEVPPVDEDTIWEIYLKTGRQSAVLLDNDGSHPTYGIFEFPKRELKNKMVVPVTCSIQLLSGITRGVDTPYDAPPATGEVFTIQQPEERAEKHAQRARKKLAQSRPRRVS